MYLDRRRVSAMACLLISTLAGAQGGGSRGSPSAKSHPDGPLQTRRPNSIETEDRAPDRGFSELGYSIEPDRIGRPNAPTSSPGSNSLAGDDRSSELREEEERLFRVIVSKDYRVSSPSDLANLDRIGERMIDTANITEEAKRVVRQVKKQRPGFFWTLARVAFETVNETRSAIQQIGDLVESNFVPDTTTVGGSLARTTTQRSTATSGDDSTDPETSATEPPFRLTVNGFQGIVRRNLRGLVRLFNIEWRDALNQSQANVREFQRDLGNRISPFLQDNPDVV